VWASLFFVQKILFSRFCQGAKAFGQRSTDMTRAMMVAGVTPYQGPWTPLSETEFIEPKSRYTRFILIISLFFNSLKEIFKTPRLRPQFDMPQSECSKISLY